MRLVISAVLVALAGIGAYLVYLKVPTIKGLDQCYRAASQAVDDKHIFARKSYTTEETICLERKMGLVKAMNCFGAIEADFQGSTKEVVVLSKLARYSSRSSLTQAEFVTNHNEECGYPSTKLQYDTLTKRWF